MAGLNSIREVTCTSMKESAHFDVEDLTVKREITKEEVQEYRVAFEIFDKDGDGEITYKELGSVIKSLGGAPTEEELKEMISELDEDNSGTIDFSEFLILMKRYMQDLDTEKDIRDTFHLFDNDCDGVLNAKELQNVMLTLGEKMTDEEIEEMIKEADTKGIGAVSYRDFYRLMNA